MRGYAIAYANRIGGLNVGPSQQLIPVCIIIPQQLKFFVAVAVCRHCKGHGFHEEEIKTALLWF